MENNKVTNKSGDKKYFTIIPRIVWMRARSPYDFTLWSVIKDVAGEDGECDLTTQELASLSMMSVGKVTECRTYLLQCGLLSGELVKPDGGMATKWHLTIPDLWSENVNSSKSLKSRKDRINYKYKQRLGNEKAYSLHESIAHSPGEQAHSPHEQANSPGESPSFIEKNHIKNHREEPNIPQRYQQEFEHWKAEQGNRIFQIEFDEPPLWTLADAKEFARLRSDGKRLEEITDRYEQYLRTNNAWYAKNGYSFSVFAKNYASFNSKILARQAETKGNGGNVESTGDRTLDVYQSAMRGAKLADEMMRGTNA